MLEKLQDCRSHAVRNALKYKKTRILLPPSAPNSARKANQHLPSQSSDDGDGDDAGEEAPLTRAKFNELIGDEDGGEEEDDDDEEPGTKSPNAPRDRGEQCGESDLRKRVYWMSLSHSRR